MSPAHPENWPVLVAKGAAEERLLKDVKALVAAAEESDGNPPLSEQTLVTLRTADTAMPAERDDDRGFPWGVLGLLGLIGLLGRNRSSQP